MNSNIETQFDDILKPLRECTKDVLYHYTTSEGLLGILRDDKLWATDIFHLNDSSEFEYGRTQILFELSKKIGDRNPYVSGKGDVVHLIQKLLDRNSEVE